MSTDLPEAALFNRADHGTQPHQLVILTANGTTWLEQLALRYRQLRSETRVEPVGLTLDGVEILSVRKLKNRLAASQIAAVEISILFDQTWVKLYSITWGKSLMGFSMGTSPFVTAN